MIAQVRSAVLSLVSEWRVGVAVRRRPYLVYTMGKVGSTAVAESLRAGGVEPVIDVHFMAGNLDQAVAEHAARGVASGHLATGRSLRRRRRVLVEKGCLVISLVRDPVARELSNAFQNPALLSLESDGGGPELTALIERLHEGFLSPAPTEYVDSWFDLEVQESFGIDVFGEPFDAERGYQVYAAGPVRLVVIRLEDLDEVGTEAIRELTGGEVSIGIEARNVRDRTSERDRYREARRRFVLPEPVLERIYSGRLAQHFYTATERQEMIRRWSVERSADRTD